MRRARDKTIEKIIGEQAEPDGCVYVLHGSGNACIASALVCGELGDNFLQRAELRLLRGGCGDGRYAGVDGCYAVGRFLRECEGGDEGG